MRLRLLTWRSTRRLSSAVILFALGLLGCNEGHVGNGSAQPSQAVSGPAAAVQTTSYQGTGVVKSINLSQSSIEIDHEEIKGLMPAMRMDFDVKDKSILQGLAPDDRIEFTIENGVGGLKITTIRKL